MKRTNLTACIYLSAAVASSAFVATQDLEGGKWLFVSLQWLALSGIPLLFVFAYPRFLFRASPSRTNRRRLAVFLNGIGLIVTTASFVYLALPFWRNPLRDVESLTILLIPLALLPVCLVAAVSLLAKGSSSLVSLAGSLLWPYWLGLALVTANHSFNETYFHTTLYFLCFLSPFLFAFAGGAVAYRPILAHSFAISGLVGVPWIYLTITRNFEIDNFWTMFNVPDRDIGLYSIHAELTILAVGAVALALVAAIFRLLPARWQFRGSPISCRTWPAFAISGCVLIFWFSRSVMPYRIPGALDYSSWPVLQILHVEKRGLQFHELSFSIWSNRSKDSFSSSRNDRRLFQYRFQRETASGPLPGPLVQRAQAIAHSPGFAKWNSGPIKPLRAWNAEGWYVFTDSSGLVSYTTENGNSAPQEVRQLFGDLEATPRPSKIPTPDIKDVCFGFCYDPLAELGWLYSNHRCFNQGHGYVCR